MTTPPTFSDQLEQAAEASEPQFIQFATQECELCCWDEKQDAFKLGAHWALQSPLVKELEAALNLVRQKFVWIGVDSLKYPATSAGDVARSSVIDIDKALAALAKAREGAE